MQLRTNGVHCQESAGTGPVNLKRKFQTDAALAGHHVPIDVSLFRTPTIGMHVESAGDTYTRYFQHARSIPIVGVGKIGAYHLVHGDLPRQRSFGTTLRFTGPVPADSGQ